MDRRSREARYLKRLLTIVATLGFAFVCLLGAIFMLYAAQGINSVMIYSPPTNWTYYGVRAESRPAWG